jgi:hypothetical protein
MPDDNIWIDATGAEAHLLLEGWDQAARLYQKALGHPNGVVAFHLATMQAQALSIQAAFRRLGIALKGPLAKPDKFFGRIPVARPVRGK